MTTPNAPTRGHVKIALTTNDLTRVDADFLTARQFVFYSVSALTAEFVDCVQFKGRPRGGGEGGGEKKGGGRSRTCSCDCGRMQARFTAPECPRVSSLASRADGCPYHRSTKSRSAARSASARAQASSSGLSSESRARLNRGLR